MSETSVFAVCSSNKNCPYDSYTSAANVVGTLMYLKQQLLLGIFLYNIYGNLLSIKVLILLIINIFFFSLP
jgi:hypothetical protein